MGDQWDLSVSELISFLDCKVTFKRVYFKKEEL